jgi:hypothetical protein
MALVDSLDCGWEERRLYGRFVVNPYKDSETGGRTDEASKLK